MHLLAREEGVVAARLRLFHQRFHAPGAGECPEGALSVTDLLGHGHAHPDHSRRCKGCLKCVRVRPVRAIPSMSPHLSHNGGSRAASEVTAQDIASSPEIGAKAGLGSCGGRRAQGEGGMGACEG